MPPITLIVGVDDHDIDRHLDELTPDEFESLGYFNRVTPDSRRYIEGARFERIAYTPEAKKWRDLFQVIRRGAMMHGAAV